ncbi:hypothetical protein E1A04_14950 [Salmonella enterica subsp. enterica serovar Virchow]|nr:hypothetical protein [Salmonella enterica subsp. enterica serovar Virchow]ECD4425555.1 hypothetical protein [Salmonella enterica subsp. enterica serovar Virchow]
MRAKERLPRKHYSPEFKMELVRLALEEEGSIAALARKHDVNDNLLFKWIRLWQRTCRLQSAMTAWRFNSGSKSAF